MKVLWTHTFNRMVNKNAGIFMFNSAKKLQELGLDLSLEYLGNLKTPLKIFKAMNHIKKISTNFDLVHSQYGSSCGYVTSVINTCPKILSLRGSDWNIHDGFLNYEHLHTTLAKILTKFSLEKYDHIVTASKRMEKDLQNIYSNIPFSAIPSPIDCSLFSPMKKMKARSLLGFPNDKDKWVLFTSNNKNNPIKRLSLARKSVAIANARMGNIKLKITKNLSHTKMPVFVNACDLILSTSDNEGWPNSVKEALACNLPFVSTDVSDLHEIAKLEPLCRICPPDAKILADNICDVLLQPRSRNLRNHVERMDMDNTSHKIINLYKQLTFGRV